MCLPILRVYFKKKRSAKDLSNDANYDRDDFVLFFFLSDFLYKSIMLWVPITYAFMKKKTKCSLAVI